MTMHPAERGELEAFRDLFLAAPPGPGARVEELGGAVCLALPETPRSAMFNRVLGLGLEEPATPGLLHELAGFFGGLGVEWCVALAPGAEPPELASWLEARGLVPGYAWAKFQRGLGTRAERETELRIVEAQPGAAAEAFADVFVRAYGTPDLLRDWVARLPGRPGWRCFLALDGETPAATGALFAKNGVGWLGIAATLPEHRRRGAQGAILAARVSAAAEEGCEVLVTETGERVEGRPSSSYRNIERAGFELAYVRPNYLSSPAADTSGTR
ncbi:MAG TPA: GNAT family N-acetyltransferase [Gaiellaceae bacterium]|nr:GNAT family N-acetyltransferase [Gaiellaceae bacterium]